MRRILLYIVFMVCVAVGLPSCSDNDGDIGLLFGLWSLQEVTVDEHTDPDIMPGTTFFAFQTDIVQVTRLLPHNDTELRTGTWSFDSGILTLDFGHRDNATKPSQHEYAPPAWIYITEPVTEMKFIKSGDDKICLSNGRYSYTLVKVI